MRIRSLLSAPRLAPPAKRTSRRACQSAPVSVESARRKNALSRLNALAGDLDRIVVEARDLVGTHAVASQPARDMVIAEQLDVGEHLVAAGAGRRARVANASPASTIPAWR